jgi:hypothetical protein
MDDAGYCGGAIEPQARGRRPEGYDDLLTREDVKSAPPARVRIARTVTFREDEYASVGQVDGTAPDQPEVVFPDHLAIDPNTPPHTPSLPLPDEKRAHDHLQERIVSMAIGRGPILGSQPLADALQAPAKLRSLRASRCPWMRTATKASRLSS